MPGIRKHGRRSTRGRPYERRRRTRRQRGGANGAQTLPAWLAAAQEFYKASASAHPSLVELRKEELTLTPGAGPELTSYYPKYLSDIMTNAAVSLGDQRIQTIQEAAAKMNSLKNSDPEFYSLLVELEVDLRMAFATEVDRTATSKEAVEASVALTNSATENTPLIWIAYANIPVGQLNPRVPVLGDLEDLKKPAPSSA